MATLCYEISSKLKLSVSSSSWFLETPFSSTAQKKEETPQDEAKPAEQENAQQDEQEKDTEAETTANAEEEDKKEEVRWIPERRGWTEDLLITGDWHLVFKQQPIFDCKHLPSSPFAWWILAEIYPF